MIEEIGADATRVWMVQKSHDTHLDFDLELAKKKSNENPVYYLQYAHARICSIQKKNEPLKHDPTYSLHRALDKAERNLLIGNIQFHDVVWRASQTNQLHPLITYGLELAKQFHAFYQHCPIKHADPMDQQLRYLYSGPFDRSYSHLFHRPFHSRIHL